MTLKKAIQHCEEIADEFTKQGACAECAAEHRQLAEWLRELNAQRNGMHWINIEQPYPRYECSNCGYHFTAVKCFSSEELYKFCPECGAKDIERR